MKLIVANVSVFEVRVGSYLGLQFTLLSLTRDRERKGTDAAQGIDTPHSTAPNHQLRPPLGDRCGQNYREDGEARPLITAANHRFYFDVLLFLLTFNLIDISE